MKTIWATVNEIMQQLDAEHPGASDQELMKLLVRELTERIPRPASMSDDVFETKAIDAATKILLALFERFHARPATSMDELMRWAETPEGRAARWGLGEPD
jgi:hypothetical protein